MSVSTTFQSSSSQPASPPLPPLEGEEEWVYMVRVEGYQLPLGDGRPAEYRDKMLRRRVTDLLTWFGAEKSLENGAVEATVIFRNIPPGVNRQVPRRPEAYRSRPHLRTIQWVGNFLAEASRRGLVELRDGRILVLCIEFRDLLPILLHTTSAPATKQGLYRALSIFGVKKSESRWELYEEHVGFVSRAMCPLPIGGESDGIVAQEEES